MQLMGDVDDVCHEDEVKVEIGSSSL